VGFQEKNNRGRKPGLPDKHHQTINALGGKN
jgi:hypothetical protein